MSTIATETSFEELVETIKLGSRSSRTNSYSSTFDGSNDSSPRKYSVHSPRDSGIWVGDSPKSAGKGQQEVAQHHLYHSPRRIDNAKDATSPTWSPRGRSDSVASSVTDKTSHSGFVLRHGAPRKGSIREDPVHPESLAKIMLDSPNHPGAHRLPARPGCVLSSCGEIQNLRGRTMDGRPVWWCRFDNMVVFDGMSETGGSGSPIPQTRSSKGLPIANAKGRLEIVHLELECDHCKDILHLQEKEWKYAARVCSRSVCAACRMRCVQEQDWPLKNGQSLAEGKEKYLREREAKSLQPQIAPLRTDAKPLKEAPVPEQKTQAKPQRILPVQSPARTEVNPPKEAVLLEQIPEAAPPVIAPLHSPIRTETKSPKEAAIPEQKAEVKSQPTSPFHPLVRTVTLVENKDRSEVRVAEPVQSNEWRTDLMANSTEKKHEPVKQLAEPFEPKPPKKEALSLERGPGFVEQNAKNGEKESQSAKDINPSQVEPRREMLEASQPMPRPSAHTTETVAPQPVDAMTEDDGLEGFVVRNLDLEYQPAQPLITSAATIKSEETSASKSGGFLSGWKKPW